MELSRVGTGMSFDFIIGTLIPNYLSATIAAGGLVVAIVSLLAARRSGREAAAARTEAAEAQQRSEEMARRELELREDTAGALSTLARWAEQQEAKTPTKTGAIDPYLITLPTVIAPHREPQIVWPWDEANVVWKPGTPVDLGVGGDAGRRAAGYGSGVQDVSLSSVLDAYASRVRSPVGDLSSAAVVE